VVENFRQAGKIGTQRLTLEPGAEVTLTFCVIFLMLELSCLLSRMFYTQTGLDIARGHLSEVIEAFFAKRKLA